MGTRQSELGTRQNELGTPQNELGTPQNELGTGENEFSPVPNESIFLIGFMGVGKSTVAAYLGRTCGLTVVEMDQVIEEREGRPISDIFATDGEACFRARETELLEELAGQKGLVVSCGGGAALRQENVDIMKQGGKVVLLTASPEEIFARVKDSDDRPLLKDRNDVQSIAELMAQRQDKYEAAADLVIDTDGKAVDEICREMLDSLQGTKD